MSLEDLIDEFVEALEFEELLAWADMLGVKYFQWLDDDFPDSEFSTNVTKIG